ncbi:MAG: DUF4350 domain-containing protein [Flavobacteriaceae bacterium]
MGKKGAIYLITVVLTVALLMVLQYNKPKELNWFPSYVAQHKIPYGTFVLNDLMGKMFSDVNQVTVPPFEFLTTHPSLEGTYFLVNDDITFGASELETLLAWTSAGNTLFIASNSFEEKLLDTLNLKISGLFAGFGDEQKQVHQLVNPNLKPEVVYPFEKDAYINYFWAIDTLQTTIIGAVDNANDSLKISKEHFDAIRQGFGGGEIILSTFPEAFTNYFILKDTHRDYTAGLLSYIDGERPVYIDNHHKSGKSFYTSPMYIFLNTKEFKWAYYLVLIGGLLYVVFEGKRKQRAIPVIIPLQNQTLAFTRTIADMYYEKGERKQISEHKIEQFLEYIRSHLHLGTIHREEDFYRKLAARSSHSMEEIKAQFNFIEKLRNQHQISDEELKKLNTLIEKFKHKADGK